MRTDEAFAALQARFFKAASQRIEALSRLYSEAIKALKALLSLNSAVGST
jgi:hypothetical protein